jgi:hypothetical protein
LLQTQAAQEAALSMQLGVKQLFTKPNRPVTVQLNSIVAFFLDRPSKVSKRPVMDRLYWLD